MSSDPPPPYPGGPNAPFLEEKNGQPPVYAACAPVMTGPPQGHSLPPEYGPPPYEATLQPGFVPPHVPGESATPKPMAVPMPMHHPHVGMEHYGPGPSHFAPGHTATDLSPPGTTTTVTFLQGEMFQSTPVPTVCPHCQQPIITCISHDIGLINTLFCLFCFFVGCNLGCCLIPCVMDSLKDVTHTCPNCKGHIYTYKQQTSIFL